ncbi:MAG: FAD-binding protein, partial [Bacteroidia bacterium]|nr:FAD-binding protein [Bacteroidia bacterium]
LPDVSYQPGITSAPLHELLPPEIAKRLQLGFIEFGKKMRGYLSNDAVIVGVESRTSSPIRIPRDVHTLQHPQINGLYPCAEGAGYAGGIVSAAIDGQKCANAIAQLHLNK